MTREPLRSTLRAGSLAVILALGSGCTAYEPLPLPEWSELCPAQDAEEAADPMSLAQAVDWLLAHNERLLGARVELRRKLAKARHGTPLANPSFSIGPVFLSGPGTLSRAHQAFEAALGWVLPMSGVRGATDDLRSAEAAAARVDAVAIAREEYLALRSELLALSVADERAAQLRQSAGILDQLVARLRTPGVQTSALELHTAELEALAAGSEATGSEVRARLALGAVARRCGTSIDRVRGLPALVKPEFPENLPAASLLRELLEEHPELVGMRAVYEVTERSLRREVRKQYPDLGVGLGFEREEKVNRIALPFGIDLPIFDRNQAGIAEALAEREGLRRRYSERARRLLQELAPAHDVLARQHHRYQSIRGRVESLVATIRRDADALVRAGRMDAGDYSQVWRRVFEAQAAELDARADLYRAWGELERVCGAPLLRLPGEPAVPSQIEENK